MGSEFSRDCPPCSTSSFGGETDMMYMPAAGTCYRKSLAPPSRIGTADHVTTGPRMAVDLQDSRRRAASEGSGAIKYALQRPNDLAAGPFSGLNSSLSFSQSRIPALLGLGRCCLERELAVMQCLTVGFSHARAAVRPPLNLSNTSAMQ